MLDMIVPEKSVPYDFSISVGDIVSGYHAGWWQVMGIHVRHAPQEPTLNLRLVLDTKGRIPPKPIYEVVDIARCRRFNPETLEQFRVENTQFLNDVCNTLKAMQEK